jgi:hypothetical protein
MDLRVTMGHLTGGVRPCLGTAFSASSSEIERRRSWMVGQRNTQSKPSLRTWPRKWQCRGQRRRAAPEMALRSIQSRFRT